MNHNYYDSGKWNVICDRCGFQFKNTEVKKTWDGFYVCEADWEPRHSLDFIKAPKPERALPYTRPEPTDTFVSVDYIDESIGQQDTTIPDTTPGNGGVL